MPMTKHVAKVAVYRCDKCGHDESARTEKENEDPYLKISNKWFSLELRQKKNNSSAFDEFGEQHLLCEGCYAKLQDWGIGIPITKF